MGGFGCYSDLDINGSREFLLICYKKLNIKSKKHQHSYSLDCGAGIGRISIDLLKKYYSNIHLLEVSKPLLDKAKESIGNYPSEYFYCSLHNFTPSFSYDIIWIQWVLGHLTDNDLVNFFKIISEGLTKEGFIVIKENTCKQTFIFDKEDSSITRNKNEIERLFDLGGLEIIYESIQKKWPSNLFPVYMWALRKRK